MAIWRFWSYRELDLRDWGRAAMHMEQVQDDRRGGTRQMNDSFIQREIDVVLKIEIEEF